MDHYVQSASLIVTLGSVFLAIAVALWALRLTVGARAANLGWRKKALGLEEKLGKQMAVIHAHPGLVLVWEDDTADPSDSDNPWGEPKLLGSPVALAAMLKFADSSGAGDPAIAMLDGLGDLEARDSSGTDTNLRERLAELRTHGTAFSLTIIGPTGRFLEADGRAAGAQVVVWLTDATIKGLEESSARGRLEEVRHIIAEDPVGFIDMLGKAPFPVWRLSGSGKLIWANHMYVETVEAENLAAALNDQVMLVDGMDDMLRQSLSERTPKSGRFQAVIDGELRYLEVGCWPVSGGLACVARDVSDHHYLREQLQRQSRAHDETLDHLADAVAIFSGSQRLIFHNTAFRNLFALDEQWLDERPEHGALLDHLRERHRLPEQADYQKWKQGELDRYGQADNRPAGDETWNLPDGRILRVAILRHPMGGLLYIFEDMTDQLTLQAQFNTLISVQRATLNKLVEAVAVFGSDGGLRLHNEAYESLWGLREADVTQNEPFTALAEKSKSLYADNAYWTEMAAAITDFSPEVRTHRQGEIIRADDKILSWVSWPLPDGATVVAWIDITDSKNVESSLREKNEAMEDAARLKADFVRHVSYQLRDPLNTIVGYADMLAGNYAGELAKTQRGPVEAILSAGNSLTTTFENILDIAAIDAGTLELELGDVDVAQIIEEVVQLAQPVAEETGLRILAEPDGKLGKIRADGVRLKQVLYNLLSNAMRYSNEGGAIGIGATSKGKEVEFWVQDEGEGIASEDQARVFEAFEGSRAGGAGLGLSLVRKLIDMHGGMVALQSEPGEGTRVSCHLPMQARTQAAAPEFALVDDDPDDD